MEIFNSLKEVGWEIERPLKEENFIVDILNLEKKIIIECFGDYWHCNPLKYKKNYYHQRVHKTAEEIWEYDRNRINKIKEYGYKVFVIWESDWSKNKIMDNYLCG